MTQKIHLKDGEVALYIGSGADRKQIDESIKKIQEMTNAKTLILSDYEFTENNKEITDRYTIIKTKNDGYKILTNNDKIHFVIIDQGATEEFDNNYTKIKTGTYIYLHNFRSRLWTHPLYQKRMGLKNIEGDLFEKTGDVTSKDIKIANQIITIDTILEYLMTISDYKKPKTIVKKDTKELQILDSKSDIIKNSEPVDLRSLIPEYIEDEVSSANFNAYGEIIAENNVSESLNILKKTLKSIKPKMNENEKNYLNKRLSAAQKKISTLDKEFYKETKEGLDALIKDFGIKK